MTETQGKTVTVQIRASELATELTKDKRKYENRSMNRRFYLDDAESQEEPLEACTKRQGEYVKGRLYINPWNLYHQAVGVGGMEPPARWHSKELAEEEHEDPTEEQIDELHNKGWEIWTEETTAAVAGETATLHCVGSFEEITVEIVEE